MVNQGPIKRSFSFPVEISDEVSEKIAQFLPSVVTTKKWPTDFSQFIFIGGIISTLSYSFSTNSCFRPVAGENQIFSCPVNQLCHLADSNGFVQWQMGQIFQNFNANLKALPITRTCSYYVQILHSSDVCFRTMHDHSNTIINY